MKYFGFIALLFFAVQCTKKVDEEVIAEAYGAKLYQSDIAALSHDGTTPTDSLFMVREFINSWVAQQVILHEAKHVLSPEELDKSEQLQAYRNDLIAYETLNKLAVNGMDSSFTDEELLDYYQHNLKEFELTENIIKFIFVKLPDQLEDLEKLWSEFVKSDVVLKDLKALAEEHHGNYSIDSASWVYFDDILKEIPINTYNQEHYLNNNKLIRINEGGFRYFVKILDFRIKSGTSPFELERERIRKILFVKKQEESVQKVETELVRKAYNNNKVIIH